MDDEINAQTIISILTGTLLIISELLPFFEKIKGNGILHLLITLGTKFLSKNNPELTRLLEETEAEYFNNLENGRDNLTNVVIDLHPENNSMKIESEQSTSTSLSTQVQTSPKINVQQINSKINSLETKVDNIESSIFSLIESKKMQKSSVYELEYIKNIIRTNYADKMYECKFLSENNKQKLLELEYIIDYDSFNKVYVIKW